MNPLRINYEFIDLIVAGMKDGTSAKATRDSLRSVMSMTFYGGLILGWLSAIAVSTVILVATS